MSEHRAWNEGAEAWTGLVRDRGGDAPMHAHDRVIRELLPPPAGPTLDVGCGEGRLTRELRALGYEAAGYDASEALVEAARLADPSGSYTVASAESLPVADAAARLAVCVNVLMHVDDLDGTVRELARVVAPGGALVVGLMHPVAEAGRYDEEADELRVSGYFERVPHEIPLGDVHVHHRHRTIEDYVRSFLAGGWSLEDLREVPGRTGSVPRYLDLLLRRR